MLKFSSINKEAFRYDASKHNGNLRPLVSLDLPENSQVELELKVIEKESNSRNQIRELLTRKGLSLKKKPTDEHPKMSAQERERLVKIFAVPEQLGELISEDREERF